MNIPNDLKYAKTHEWVKIDGKIARVGITDFAQQELTDIVFAEVPKEGSVLVAGKGCAVVESVKTASDIYAPVSGKVSAINRAVIDAPEIINSDPYGNGWLFEVEMSNPKELDNLLTPDGYKNLIE